MSTVISPQEGSTFYYALLKTNSQDRADVCSLLRFCDVLASVLHDVSEPTVAEQKIHWWHQEIERLQNGEARHPAATIVYPVMRRYSLKPESLMSILQANNNEKFINATNDEEYRQRLLTDYGARLALCASVLLQNTDERPLEWQAVPAWAHAFGTFDRLRQLIYLHHRAYPVLPDSDYQNAGIEPAGLTSPDASTAVSTLLAKHIDYALTQFDTGLKQPPQDDRVLPIYLCGTLRQAQLNEWRKKPLDLLQQYTGLTPLRKFWISLRARPRLRSVRQSA